VITGRLADALDFAVRAHGDQIRKGTTIPYVSHVLGVAALVFEGGGDEDLAIAGLLHDVLEDTSASAAQIADAFGPRVAVIVRACSDTEERPKPPALERKRNYLKHLAEADADTLLVSLADKLHNSRTILLDFRTDALGLLRRFNLSGNQTIWYYSSLADIYRRRRPGPLADELSRVVADLRRELRNLTACVADPEWVMRYGEEAWECARALIGKPVDESGSPIDTNEPQQQARSDENGISTIVRS
jgi:hypothetical protein